MAEENLEQVVEQPEEPVKKHKLNEKAKSLIIFWARMAGWVISSCGVPISVFAIKFGLFDKTGYQINTDALGNVTSSNIALNGWGIVSCILIGVAIINVLYEVIDAFAKKYSLAKQCLVGLVKRILPIAIAIGVCFFLKGVLDQVIFCLIIVGVSQLAAIPLNPLPAWKYKIKGEEDYSDVITGLRHLIKINKDKKGDK